MIHGLLLMPLALLFAGCASKTPQTAIKEISLCSTNKCSPISSTTPLMTSVHQLIKTNENNNIPICVADPKTHTCKSEKVCYFVLGGLLPGNGCAEKLMFSDVATQQTNAPLNMKTNMPLSFVSTKVSCDAAVTTLAARSANEIVIELEPYHCSWMLVGQMKAKFSFYIDSINIDNGQIAGYWAHSVAGTGNGSGSGYAILSFPKNITWNK